jgi:hypothetical protein
MRRGIWLGALLALVASVLTQGIAYGDPCDPGASTDSTGIGVLVCDTEPPSKSGEAGTVDDASSRQPTFEWRLACGDKSSATDRGGAQPCAGDTACPPKQHLYRLWQVTPALVPMGIQCSATTPDAPSQQLTAAMIARAFQHVPLPGLVTHIQPQDKTLVNFDTIFYTDAQPITRTLTLLGQQVRLDITPSSFRWAYGDGSETTTSVPGAPYPSKVVTHRYPHAHTTVAAHVAVTWTARYSVNGGASQPVDGTVTTVGPDTPLRIAEAIPALSGAGH